VDLNAKLATVVNRRVSIVALLLRCHLEHLIALIFLIRSVLRSESQKSVENTSTRVHSNAETTMRITFGPHRR
jgi:hypothetical protein